MLVLFLTRTPNNPPLFVSTPIQEDALFDLVQEWRTSNKLEKYIKSDVLCDYAEKRSIDIQTEFSHRIFLETSKQFLNDTQFDWMGENLIKDYEYNEDALIAWLNSPVHKENLDYPYTHSCIKCINTACVQLFAR